MEILIIGAIILFVLIYNNTIDKNKFFADNEKYLEALKEKDYEFLVYARYGENVDVKQLYMKRVTYGIFTFFMVLAFAVSGGEQDQLGSEFFLYLALSAVVAFVVFKSSYSQLKSYYKKHLHEIDIMLPYYLKSLEILIQHYTVPVALARSIEDAPEVFKPGLRKMIQRIEAGDSSIDPYMDFANQYPVRDSMRMMRLLYRLSLGEQDKKHEQMLSFSKTVSSLSKINISNKTFW